MDYTPYEDSLAAINGLPVDLESKPATDFATYIQTLLDNPAPRGFLLSGRAPATAEEELELKKAEEAIKKLVPASMFAGEGDAGDGFAPAGNGTGFSMGKGKATDAIVTGAIQSAVKGFMKGGLLGAVTDGLFSYGSGMLGLQQQINDTTDPLGTWSVLQGWAPVPVVNLSTPSTMFSDSIADGGYQGPTSSDQGTVGGVTVGGPIDSSVPTVTPLGPLGGSTSSGGGGHDAGVTGGNSFGGSNADGGGYNE